MPRYEYECVKCGYEFEEEHNISSDVNERECPKCKAIAEKIISKTSFTMTGYASINGYSNGNVTR